MAELFTISLVRSMVIVMWRGCWWWPCVRRSIKAGDLSVFERSWFDWSNGAQWNAFAGISTKGDLLDPKGCKRLAHVHVCFHNSSYYSTTHHLNSSNGFYCAVTSSGWWISSSVWLVVMLVLPHRAGAPGPLHSWRLLKHAWAQVFAQGGKWEMLLYHIVSIYHYPLKIFTSFCSNLIPSFSINFPLCV